MDNFDPALEALTRWVARQMGEPEISDREWDILFGRESGKLPNARMAKMSYAHAVARALAD
jgi:hypothetical protein